MERDIVKLDAPMPVGDAKRAEYARNGILLRGKGPRGYSRIEAAFELGVPDFASLSSENLYDLVPYVQETKYKKITDMAERAQVLVTQAKTVHKDGFLYPTKDKPFTWELRDNVPAEIENQMRLLKKHGITEVKVGLEMEFTVPEKPVKGFNKWRTVKRTILAGLKWELSKTDGPVKRKRIQEKIDEVRGFNAREIMMFDLVEMDPRTKGILELIFGANSDGGYYDGINCLELKLKPDDPKKLLENRKTALAVLYEKSLHYGLEVMSHPGVHINVSLWDKNGNLFDDKHPKFNSKTPRITEGVVKAFYDSIFALVEKYEARSERLMKVGLDINRQNILRYSSNRLEVRPAVRDERQDPDLMLSVFLAGAIYGLGNPESRDIKRAVKVKSPVIHHKRLKSETLAQVLGNSSIEKDGRLAISNEYVREHQMRLEYELGIGEKPTAQDVNPIFKILMTSDYEKYVKAFLGSIKVEKDGKGKMVLVFPKTPNGKYTFYLPPINMHLIPAEMRKRIIDGEEIKNHEFSDYISPGSRIPRPGKLVSIDVNAIAGSLEVVGIKSKYVVKDYDLNKGKNKRKPRNFTKAAWARYQRLYYSRSLAHSMSKDFKRELKKEAKKFARNERLPKPQLLTRKGVADIFFNKVKDRDYTYETKSKVVSRFWYESGRVEGKDYFKNGVVFKFENIEDGAGFEVFINRLFTGINKRYVRKHKYIVNVDSYGNGTSDATVQVTPRFMKVLKKLAA